MEPSATSRSRPRRWAAVLLPPEWGEHRLPSPAQGSSRPAVSPPLGSRSAQQHLESGEQSENISLRKERSPFSRWRCDDRDQLERRRQGGGQGGRVSGAHHSDALRGGAVPVRVVAAAVDRAAVSSDAMAGIRVRDVALEVRRRFSGAGSSGAMDRRPPSWRSARLGWSLFRPRDGRARPASGHRAYDRRR